jgi:hypothetical protein
MQGCDMPPKSDSNKMALAQLDAVFDAMVKFRPVGGDDDGKMVKKTGGMAIVGELHVTMPEVIHDLPQGSPWIR